MATAASGGEADAWQNWNSSSTSSAAQAKATWGRDAGAGAADPWHSFQGSSAEQWLQRSHSSEASRPNRQASTGGSRAGDSGRRQQPHQPLRPAAWKPAAASTARPAQDMSWQRHLPKLHKDFYLCHPEPSLQCEEFCWGNLEAANPILSERTSEEVEEYRRSNGIYVQVVRGRDAPKPFQSFRAETSFPDFVEELAYELFTTDAVPFPVQAQVWPCALSGMDVVAVAPTGSGKTLAFLLPALVHIMAQPPLVKGNGPIVVILEPTRELVQQTHVVAQKFCERTRGQDMLRAGAVFGGVDPTMQLPSDDAPDLGRWPELLVATPGRLLDLLGKQLLDPGRISYFVLDEADLLLSLERSVDRNRERSGDRSEYWLRQVREILNYARPDRQLLFFSATWPAEAEAAAGELCGEELVRIRVEPRVPCIPQAVQLFHGLDGSAVKESFNIRREALRKWLGSELQPDEAVLVLCASERTAGDLATDSEILEMLPGGTSHEKASQVGVFVSGPQEVRDVYWEFIHGKVRVLFSTFAIGSRGLDYADSAVPRAEAEPISLAVVLFDFPRTIKDYAHCIGRTARPGQRDGRAVCFLPEMRFWIARELVGLLEHCGQEVPPSLSKLLAEDTTWAAECREAMLCLKAGENPVSRSTDSGIDLGTFDTDWGVWTLPASLPSYRRKLLHDLANELELPHVSTGQPPNRCLNLAVERSVLPERFFIEGEEVWVEPRQDDGHPTRAMVVDPKIRPWKRTVKVRFRNGHQADIPVDVVHPGKGGA